MYCRYIALRGCLFFPSISGSCVTVSDSLGQVGVVELCPSGPKVTRLWKAHGYEAWITCFGRHGQEDHTVFSGGDDCKLCVWDLRLGTASPCFVSKWCVSTSLCTLYPSTYLSSVPLHLPISIFPSFRFSPSLPSSTLPPSLSLPLSLFLSLSPSSPPSLPLTRHSMGVCSLQVHPHTTNEHILGSGRSAASKTI